MLYEGDDEPLKRGFQAARRTVLARDHGPQQADSEARGRLATLGLTLDRWDPMLLADA